MTHFFAKLWPNFGLIFSILWVSLWDSDSRYTIFFLQKYRSQFKIFLTCWLVFFCFKAFKSFPSILFVKIRASKEEGNYAHSQDFWESNDREQALCSSSFFPSKKAFKSEISDDWRWWKTKTNVELFQASLLSTVNIDRFTLSTSWKILIDFQNHLESFGDSYRWRFSYWRILNILRIIYIKVLNIIKKLNNFHFLGDLKLLVRWRTRKFKLIFTDIFIISVEKLLVDVAYQIRFWLLKYLTILFWWLLDFYYYE